MYLARTTCPMESQCPNCWQYIVMHADSDDLCCDTSDVLKCPHCNEKIVVHRTVSHRVTLLDGSEGIQSFKMSDSSVLKGAFVVQDDSHQTPGHYIGMVKVDPPVTVKNGQECELSLTVIDGILTGATARVYDSWTDWDLL